MDNICFFSSEQLQVYGDLQRRLNLNFARLESRHYRPEHIFGADKSGWPGDWEGRTILALVKLKDAAKREPAYLRDILHILPGKLNSNGYLGEIHGVDSETGLPIFNEQQLSGHNWLLRGLLEYYLLSGDADIKNIAVNIVNNLYLPLLGHYKDYPLSPAERDSVKGRYDGNICGKVRNWLISTDIGCAFMCLDALSQAYEVLQIPSCKILVDEMLSVFANIDFVGCAMQTHATLSATRGVLRMYSVTKKVEYLEAAVKIFDIYINNGMTENYANFNWFSRSDSWTEPCAIVDSWICAFELFKFTDNYFYISLANKIYRNALCYAERVNGGFGCDKCVTPSQKFLMPNGGANLTEAFWCCTMRGAEGLASIVKNIAHYTSDEDGMPKRIYINMLESIDICCDYFNLSLVADINGFKLTFFNKTGKRIYIYAYDPYNNEHLRMCGELGICIWEHKYTCVPVFDGGKFLLGDCILGVRNVNPDVVIAPAKVENLVRISGNSFKDSKTGLVYEPLCSMTDVEADELDGERRQIIFID